MMLPMRCTIGLRHDITMLKSAKDGKVEDGASCSGKDKTAKDIPVWVQPKERFMKLLKSVGAEGPRFTPQEVMSLLIKYISSRSLFDQDDPKKVYCKNDPLGDVFGVSMFTIQDARRLLFENLIVLQRPGQKSGNPDQNSSCYFTFSHHSIQKPNMQDARSGQVLGACAIKSKDGLDGAVSKPCDVGTSRIPFSTRQLSTSSSTPSSVKKQKTRRRKRTKPKVKTNKSELDTPDKPGTSSKKLERPWYCVVYKDGEDLQSRSSEILSIQDNETIEAHNSSDDLWFLEDEFAVEFEVLSSSSSAISHDQSEDEQSDGSKIILDVNILDSGESRLGDYSSTVDSDEEISDADKWRCMECNTKNSPLCRYCVRCMAVRSEWLPDEQRMTLWERLHHQEYPVKRAVSAPVSNQPLLPSYTNQAKTFATSARETSHTYLNVTGIPIDVSDGRTNQVGPGKASHPSPNPQQHPPRPQQLVASHNPNQICAKPNPLEQRLQVPPLQEGIDEGGVSTNSPNHGPGSQTTLSEGSNMAQNPLKRPWSVSKTREDSGLGLSLQAFSSQSTTNTLSSSQPPHISRETGTTNTLNSSQPPHSSQETSHGGTIKRLKMDHQQRDPSKPEYGNRAATSSNTSPIAAQGSHYSTMQPPRPATGTSTSSTATDLCTICCSRRKNGSIVHGKSGHQICCYQCAKKLQKRGKPCPACRKPIEYIIKNYIL